MENVRNIEDRPNELEGRTLRVESGCGRIYITINKTKDYPVFEVFANSGKSGSCISSMLESLTKVISISLRAGVPAEDILKQIDASSCPMSDEDVLSCPEAIAEGMERFLEEETDYERPIIEENGNDENNSSPFEECPECGEETLDPSAEGCAICKNCGYSPCK